MKGIEYFTSVVRVKGSKFATVVPVKSSKPLDKELWLECSKAISILRVGPPVEVGDVLCKNILNTGLDIVSTKNILE